MICDYNLLGACLTRPPVDSDVAIFGFAEFLAAMALLVLVFNSSDFLYRFRISIAPLPLFPLTFGATVAIGLGTLLTDLWFAERWYALPWGLSRSLLQAIFGLLFLSAALLWMWFAFIRPPIFGRWNYKHFYNAVFRVIVRGSDAQLAELAGELARSGDALVRLAAIRTENHRTNKPTVADYAHDALFMLANRKLCRHIVASSPATAIIIMESASELKKYDIPLGGFASSVTTEAILNKDSILYHEDNYGEDLVSHVQPFTNSMYGDYRLVEGNWNRKTSPLDINWRVAWEMDGEQFKAYCRITLTTFKSFIESGTYLNHSYSMFRAIDLIKEGGRDLSKLNDAPIDAPETKTSRRLTAAVEFSKDAIDFLAEQGGIEFGHLRDRSTLVRRRETIFDDIADLMFELIHSAAYVRSGEQNWWIQHNIVWSGFFTFREESKAWRVIRHKLFRLIFDEIKRMEEWPNYKGARILGLCLNVMGISDPKRSDYGKEYYALRKAVIGWTRRNYLRLAEVQPNVAEHCLVGGITFDAENRRLVKTFTGGLRLEPSRQYLNLDEAKPSSAPTPKSGRRRKARKATSPSAADTDVAQPS